MNTANQGWLTPRCETRTGAAHRRRGSPCQDASGLWSFTDAEGEPLHALVVSDGHGGLRYDRSEVGSRLACVVTLRELQRQLAGASLRRRTDPEEWRRWLAEALPARLLERWRQEVLAHAAAHPREDGAAPSTLPYGATLGVLLLTPRWWGHTGLGDWDLVRIGNGGPAELISEEPDSAGGGEATFSLCMQGAEHQFACRSGLVPIEAEPAPFSLLLSSDGIRKSCDSDSDFLALARHLGERPDSGREGEPSALAEALDHISSQGSGDDVSVAIARWGERGDAPPWTGQRWQDSSRPLIVQPWPEPRTNGPAGPNAAVQMPLGRSGETPQARQGAPEEHRRTERRWPPDWGIWGVAILALAMAATGATALLGWGAFSGRKPEPVVPDPALAAVLQKEVARLCGPRPPAGPAAPAARTTAGVIKADRGSSPRKAEKQDPASAGGRKAPETTTAAAGSGSSLAPSGTGSAAEAHLAAGAAAGTSPASDEERRERITATLDQRRSDFLALQRQTTLPATFLSQPHQDHTGALIAWSQNHPDLQPLRSASSEGTSPMSRLIRLLQASVESGRMVPEAQRPAGACAELLQALRLQWQRARSEASSGSAGAAGPPAGRSGPDAPGRPGSATPGRPVPIAPPAQPPASPNR